QWGAGMVGDSQNPHGLIAASSRPAASHILGSILPAIRAISVIAFSVKPDESRVAVVCAESGFDHTYQLLVVHRFVETTRRASLAYPLPCGAIPARCHKYRR